MWSTVRGVFSGWKKTAALLAATGILSVTAGAQEIKACYAQLDNGLKVIIYPRNRNPIVACRLFYVTGSVHEAPGHVGIAHLLEHLLFKGTHKVGTHDSTQDLAIEARIDTLMDTIDAQGPADSLHKAALMHRYDSLLTEQRKYLTPYELWGAYEKAGGTDLNAFTADLMTAYFVTLPRNKVELFLWLESDRMQHAVFREFYPERDVVMEERRMRVDDSPTGRYWESLLGVFYEAHPYRFPTIGYPSDLRHLSRREAEDHYRRYYKPNNAILVLAGDVDTTWALRKIKEYFGSIPRGEDFPPIVTEEPVPAGEKRLLVRRNDASPRLDIMFHTPGYPNPDLYALDVAEAALSGNSGRLYRKLVKEKKLAISASAGNDVELYTSNFQVSVDLDGNPPIDQVEKATWEVLDGMTKTPLSDRELERARNQVFANSVREGEDLEGLATDLASWEMRGSWRDINRFPREVQKITAEQVRAACAKYFHREAATIGEILPRAADESQTAAKGGGQ